MRGSAQPRQVNLRNGHTCDRQLVVRRLRTVEVPVIRMFAIGVAIVEPSADVLGRETSLFKSRHDRQIDFVAGRADRRPDGGNQILGPASELASPPILEPRPGDL